ncbi:hypothetical protein ACO2I3_01355 [Leptospira interrogans]
MNRSHVAALITACCVGLVSHSVPGAAQDNWRPFADRDAERARAQERAAQQPWGSPSPQPWGSAAPIDRTPLPSVVPAPITRSELAPAISNDGSGLPFDLWTGLDLQTTEQSMARLELPPLSPTMHGLWRRLMTSTSGTPAGANQAVFTAIQAEALYRSGLFEPLADVLARAPAAETTPIFEALEARRAVAVGQVDQGCQGVKNAAARKDGLPPSLRGEILALAGYCAAAAGNPSAASLAGELAREEGLDDPVMLAALDAVAAGRAVRLPKSGRIGPSQYRVIALSKQYDVAAVLQRAEAPLLAALVIDPATDDRLRLVAAEAAARLNAIDAKELVQAWRGQRFSPQDLADPLSAQGDPALRRALLFQAAETERHPARRAQILRALLDDARRAGIYLPALISVAPLIGPPPRSPDGAAFGELAIEAALANGDHAQVHAWVAALNAYGNSSPLHHWLALSDIADPNPNVHRGASLGAVEDLARRGRFSAPVLHRLATVLDALDYQVPMGLWEISSNTPQPNDGHLPETGVLAQLKEASSRKEFGRTVLLTMRALGSKGAEGAHIIALGDAIRALRIVGLEAEARRIGFEALFAAWPRSASH